MRKTSVILQLMTSAALLAGSASVAAAKEQPILTWRGEVDREVQIVMRGRQVGTRFLGRNESGRSQAHATARLPEREGYVTVELRDGRGSAEVIQQPSARNGYTTIIRIRDDRPGGDRYRLVAYWDDDRRGGWGRGRGRGGDGDGVWNQRDRDDDERYDDRYDGRGRDGGYDGRSGGYGAGAVHWSGSVDDVAELRIQGRRVDLTTLSGAPVRDARYDVSGSGLPHRPVAVTIRQNGGRGAVQVLQQPTSQNGYTAIVRIRDFQGGSGWYDLDLTW